MPHQPSRALVPTGTGLRAALRSRSRVARSARAILRVSILAAGLALAIFHASLFWDRLVGGDLLDPMVALRWTGAGLLLAALVTLRRYGAPLIHGRKAFCLWLLIALLHASSASVPTPTPATASGVETGLIFVLPSTTVLIGLGLLHATIVRRRLTPAPFVVCRVEPGATAGVSPGWRPSGASRAPPFAFA
jgi:hypothetical protein